MTGLGRRLARLEGHASAEGCEECSGVFVVRFMNLIFEATRDGEPIPEEEARAQPESCPECGRRVVYVIRLKGLDEKPRNDPRGFAGFE